MVEQTNLPAAARLSVAPMMDWILFSFKSVSCSLSCAIHVHALIAKFRGLAGRSAVLDPELDWNLTKG